MHGGTLPSLDSASLSLTELDEYSFRASTLLQKLLPISSQEKSVFLPLRATYLPSPCSLLNLAELQFICITVSVLKSFSISLESRIKLAEIRFLLQNVQLFFQRRPTFSLGEFHLAHAANRMRQKGNLFTCLSSHRTHSAHIMLQTGVGSVLFTI